MSKTVLKRLIIFSLTGFFVFIHSVSSLPARQSIGDLSLTVKIIRTHIEEANKDIAENPLNERYFLAKKILEEKMQEIIAENQLAALAMGEISRIADERAHIEKLLERYKDNKAARQKLLELANFLDARNEEYFRVLTKFRVLTPKSETAP